MSKELEEFERIIEKTDSLNNTCVHLPKCLKDNKCRYNIDNLMCPDYEMANNIKQALLKAQGNEKVLEIIKKKDVDISYLKNECHFELCLYNKYLIETKQLTEEEFDLLKRWIE